MKKKDKVYYARAIPSSDIYDVCELVIRTVSNTWFVGVDKDSKQAHLISNSEIGKTVFKERKDALEKIRSLEVI